MDFGSFNAKLIYREMTNTRECFRPQIRTYSNDVSNLVYSPDKETPSGPALERREGRKNTIVRDAYREISEDNRNHKKKIS